jgi:hypothetical protein
MLRRSIELYNRKRPHRARERKLTRPTAAQSSNEDSLDSMRSAPLARTQNGRVSTRIRLPPRQGSATAPLGLQSGAAYSRIVIEVDISRTVVLLRDEDAELLCDRAAARAGRSAAARDLSLLLNQALTSRRRITLQRGELKALRQLLTAHPRLECLLTTFDQPPSDAPSR